MRAERPQQWVPVLMMLLVLAGAAGMVACRGGGPELATYENDVVSYTVQYPAEWTIDENNPLQVVFQPEEGNGQMLVDALEPEEDLTLRELVDIALENTHQRMEGVEELAREEVTLPGGQAGQVLDLRYDNPDDTGGTLRSKILLTIAEGRIFQVEVALLDDDFTDDFGEQANEIVRSLTISAPDGTAERREGDPE